MKSFSLPLVFALAMPLTANGQEGCCDGTRPVNRVFRDAATHESILEKAKGAENPVDQFKHLTPPPNPEHAQRENVSNLIDRSEIIHRGDLVTLVPKRAVLHLPESLKGVRGKVLGKRLVTWPEFYRANRSWIETVEVNRAQAEGREPLSEELIKSFEKRTKAVVAVIRGGGPVSVLPLEIPEEESTEILTTSQP